MSVLLILLATFFGNKDVSVKTVESAQKYVVPILCMQELEGKEIRIKKIMGTGFFINRQGHFVTAGHILEEWGLVSTNESPCFPAIYAPQSEWSKRTTDKDLRWFKFTECQYSKELDVAACKTIENPFSDATTKDHIRPAQLGSFVGYGDGTPVAFTGFPLDSTFPITSKGYIASYISSVKQLIIDKGAWPGASGSPVYDQRGRVIAVILKRGINEGIGLAYARPIDFVLDFLREKKIPVEK